MRRTDRLFEIIQILRGQTHSITAHEIAARLEVSVRTVYRDIQTLQAMRTPIEGEAGVGYLMRRGYDLPALNFSNDEIEAIVVGLSLLSRTGDIGLQKAAAQVSLKIDSVRQRMESLQVSGWGVPTPQQVDPELLRIAIRDEQKLDIVYSDENNTETQRSILPLAIIYYVETIVLAAWCELRNDFRHFRVDRINRCELSSDFFKGKSENLRTKWQATQE